MLTVLEAQEKISSFAQSWGVEIIPIEKSLGRILAENTYADRDYPPFHRAAMDGYAFRADDFLIKNIRCFKVVEVIYAGDFNKMKLQEGTCYKIMTGAATPSDADTIIRIEDTVIQEDASVLFQSSSLKRGANIAKQGEDNRKGNLVIPLGVALNPIHLASLAVIGCTKVSVFALPKVSILSTGNELKSSSEKVLGPTQIRESNSVSIEFFLKKYGITINHKEIIPDQKEEIEQAILKQEDADILILSGGVSMGDADYVPEAIENSGFQKQFHQVAIKPGKPILFATKESKVIFALPGNPFSVQVAFKIFIEPFLRKSFQLTPQLVEFKLPIKESKNKKISFDEYFPCILTTEEQTEILPVKINGSGDVTSVIRTQGIALHPSGVDSLPAGTILSFYPW